MKEGRASANIILGTDWLKLRKARMCWETDTFSLQRGGNRVSLRPNYAQGLSEPARLMNLVTATLFAATSVDLLSAKQAAKAIMKGADAFLMLVREEVDSVTPDSTTAQSLASAVADHSASVQSDENLVQEHQLQALLAKYKDVFAEVTGI